MSPVEDLVRRLRATQQRRAELHELKDRAGELTAADLAVSLCADVPWAVLRDALLHATNPASVPPIPVVLGPQDVAAIIGHSELMALVCRYATACFTYGATAEADRAAYAQACVDGYRAIDEAAQRLFAAVAPVELRGAAEGRQS